jgi:hypothetical protein
VIAYLPNKFVLFAAVQPDGSYTIPNVPSGTYALAFLGCSGGDPQPVVPDPTVAGVNYAGVWWNGAPVKLGNQGGGGPDPIAQGANLVTVTPGANLTGYDTCFGCGAITITSITPGPNSLTVAFVPPDLADPGDGGTLSAASRSLSVLYTVTCTSPGGGVSGSASGPDSPITVTGLTQGASYACQVTADSGGTLLATSDVSHATLAADGGGTNAGGTGATDPASAGVSGTLPRTGASSPMTLVRAGFMLLVLGLVLVGAGGRRRRLLPGLDIGV